MCHPLQPVPTGAAQTPTPPHAAQSRIWGALCVPSGGGGSGSCTLYTSVFEFFKQHFELFLRTIIFKAKRPRPFNCCSGGAVAGPVSGACVVRSAHLCLVPCWTARMAEQGRRHPEGTMGGRAYGASDRPQNQTGNDLSHGSGPGPGLQAWLGTPGRTGVQGPVPSEAEEASPAPAREDHALREAQSSARVGPGQGLAARYLIGEVLLLSCFRYFLDEVLQPLLRGVRHVAHHVRV